MSGQSDIRQGEIEANGLRFGYLEAGDGPLVLLLHGFPDNAWTWSAQIHALSEAGYRPVAPFIRGYAPTGIPADGRFDPGALGDDVAALIRAFGEERAFVVGNDWGAVSTYAAMALHPEVIRRAAVIATGHPSTLPSTLIDPEQMKHIFHFWFFQLEEMAAPIVRNDDFRWIDYLWKDWCADGHEDAEHIAGVKRTLAPEGVTEAALGYYPALLNSPANYPEVSEKLQGKTTVPTLAIFGESDLPRLLSTDEHAMFTGEYRLEIVEGAGHFVQREQPEELNRLLLDWFAGDGASAGGDRSTTAVSA